MFTLDNIKEFEEQGNRKKIEEAMNWARNCQNAEIYTYCKDYLGIKDDPDPNLSMQGTPIKLIEPAQAKSYTGKLEERISCLDGIVIDCAIHVLSDYSVIRSQKRFERELRERILPYVDRDSMAILDRSVILQNIIVDGMDNVEKKLPTGFISSIPGYGKFYFFAGTSRNPEKFDRTLPNNKALYENTIALMFNGLNRFYEDFSKSVKKARLKDVQDKDLHFLYEKDIRAQYQAIQARKQSKQGIII